jgi:hypothetical protein
MNIALNILAGPFNLCLHIVQRVQLLSGIVNDSFMGRRPIEMLLVGKLVWWALLAVVMAAVVYLTVKYVLENIFAEPLALKDIPMLLGGIFWRLVAVFIIYVIVSVLLYAYASYTHMVSSGMDLPHRQVR